MNKYKTIIGLEIHVELGTKSKMFCQCDADFFDKEPNTNTCPVCLGLPGALPVPNKQAVEWTILIGKALNCTINQNSKFDRKHYFYPDLPKGYQISQYDEPVAVQGRLQLKVKNEKLKTHEKTFRIRRVHLEEDTGKLIHKEKETLVDFNRSGVPLVEIVTEPDFSNSDEVKMFLQELHTIIRYLGVSDADMEKGSMRLEPNISLKLISNSKAQISNNDKLPSYKVEVKNINSFNFAKRAIDYEIKRQAELLDKGETPAQETRGFDENKMKTFSQRSKEEAHDYRYFPEPDIPPMKFEQKFLDELKVPELPAGKVKKYVTELGIKESDAFILTRDKKLTEYFEQVSAKCKVPSQDIANAIVNKRISTTLSADEFIEQLTHQSRVHTVDDVEMDSLISTVLKENKDAVDSFKAGKENAVMFLVGQVMKEMKGKADPQAVKKILLEKLTS